MRQAIGPVRRLTARYSSTAVSLSKLEGLSDSAVASQISTVGGAVIQSAQALNQLGVFGSGAGRCCLWLSRRRNPSKYYQCKTDIEPRKCSGSAGNGGGVLPVR